MLGGTDLISYERVFSEHSTGTIGVGSGGFKILGYRYAATGAELQYRYYYNQAIRGWYTGGSLSYQSGKVEDTNSSDELNFSGVALGVKGGYQWSWESGFTLDLNLGANYVNLNYDDNSNSSFSDVRGSGIVPQFGLGLGYAF